MSVLSTRFYDHELYCKLMALAREKDGLRAVLSTITEVLADVVEGHVPNDSIPLDTQTGGALAQLALSFEDVLRRME